MKYLGQDDFIRFEVHDTGPGVDPGMHKKIFEPFAQVDNSNTRGKGGTGLGLSISRNLCKAMGGRIRITNRPDKGAIFWFEIPLPAHEVPVQKEILRQPDPLLQKQSRANIALQPRKKQLLIVDDSPINRLLLKRYLKNCDFDIDESPDGQTAVKAASGKAYDAILMDIQMPVMDGVEATQSIRENENAQNTPRAYIIAVTANIMTHQIHDYLKKGIDEVLGKPLSKEDLLNRLNSISTCTNVPTSRYEGGD